MAKDEDETTKKPKFFNWVSDKYVNKSDVPARLLVEMKLMRYYGASPAEMSQLFNMPLEWAEEFTSDVIPKDSFKN